MLTKALTAVLEIVLTLLLLAVNLLVGRHRPWKM